jgi:hypothetical protein
VNTGVIEVSV